MPLLIKTTHESRTFCLLEMHFIFLFDFDLRKRFAVPNRNFASNEYSDEIEPPIPTIGPPVPKREPSANTGSKWLICRNGKWLLRRAPDSSPSVYAASSSHGTDLRRSTHTVFALSPVCPLAIHKSSRSTWPFRLSLQYTSQSPSCRHESYTQVLILAPLLRRRIIACSWTVRF